MSEVCKRYSRVNTLDTLHDDPGLSVGGELGHKGIVGADTGLLEEVGVDRHLNLPTDQVCCLVCLNGHGVLRQLDKWLTR